MSRKAVSPKGDNLRVYPRRVSIRCMSRKAVSLLVSLGRGLPRVSIRCMSRKAVSPNAIRVPRLAMPHMSQSAACRGRLSAEPNTSMVRWAEVSIRCMSRKAVSPSQYNGKWRRVASQSAACRGRLSARFEHRTEKSLWRLNPLHVAEGCQPCAVGALRSIVESQSAACRGRLSAALSLAEVRHAGVSIRCMSRKAVSLLEYCHEPGLGLNPLHVAEGCQ